MDYEVEGVRLRGKPKKTLIIIIIIIIITIKR